MFSKAVWQFANSYVNHAPVVIFGRGAWGLLGVSLGLSGLLVWALIETITQRPPGKGIARVAGRLIVVGLVLMFVLPVASGLAVGPMLERRGYSLCEQAAYQYHLPGLGEKIYVNRPELCVGAFSKLNYHLYPPQ